MAFWAWCWRIPTDALPELERRRACRDLSSRDTSRFYSLCGDPAGDGRATLAILREEAGRGGSRLFHERLQPGMELKLRGPRNHFRLDEAATRHVLIAGGIGITPIIAMADRLKRLGRDYELHYSGRSRQTMAFLDRIERDHGGRATLYPADEGRRADLAALVGRRGAAGQVYACGPDRMIDVLKELTADLPAGAFAFEHFTGGDVALDPQKEQGFDVDLVDSGLSLHVPPDRTLLSVLRGAGIDLPSDCEEGLCGTCEVRRRRGRDRPSRQGAEHGRARRGPPDDDLLLARKGWQAAEDSDLIRETENPREGR